MAAQRRRTLLDLYTKGTEVVFDDNHEDDDPDNPVEPVKVWVQKLSPSEHDVATKKASAARARARAVLNDKQSEDFLAIYDDIVDYDRATTIVYLAADKEMEARLSVESELEMGDDSEWGKDGYARGLVDAWADKLEAVYVEDPEDPEVTHVLSEMRRFGEEVERRIEPIIKDIREGFDALSTEKLHEMMVEQVLESRLTSVWVREYERCRIWLGTRLPEDHNTRYFLDRDDIDHLYPEVRERLTGVIEALSVSPTAGKGSPGSRRSSRPAATLAMAASVSSPPAGDPSTSSPKS